MASNSTLETFDPAVESVDDYKERFDFYCTAAGSIKGIVLSQSWTGSVLESENIGQPTAAN